MEIVSIADAEVDPADLGRHRSRWNPTLYFFIDQVIPRRHLGPRVKTTSDSEAQIVEADIARSGVPPPAEAVTLSPIRTLPLVVRVVVEAHRHEIDADADQDTSLLFARQ